MPQHYPLTPGSSSDITGQDGTKQLSALHLAFELPPPAIHDASRVSPGSTDNRKLYAPTGSSPYPMQAAEAVKSRRRSSAAKEPKTDDFALPPPPTRSRKIIQMQPKEQQEEDTKEASSSTSTGKQGKANTKAGGNAAASKAKDAGVTKESGKKKQPTSTSAAGRKIARKTAHSLIERRRRSKMNEEFALLKSMIPACTGEMHKLAILQASIEYVRYLEDCISKLKANHGENNQGDPALPSIRDFHPTFRDEENDIEMSDTEQLASPTFQMHPTQQQQHQQPRHPSQSPAMYAQDSQYRQRQPSQSSTAGDYHHRHFSFSSATASPAFGPQQHPHPAGGYTYPPSGSGSTLTSPALQPQTDLDQEATAALLMLNNDRRGVNHGSNHNGGSDGGGRDGHGRGLSVRDLLST